MKTSTMLTTEYAARYDGGLARASGLKDLRRMVGSDSGEAARKTNLNYFFISYDEAGFASAERIHSNGVACVPCDDDADVCASLLRDIGAPTKEVDHA